jgi:hypothetical protein
VAPVFFIVTISLVKPIFVGRYILIAVPALIAVAAIGFTRMRPMLVGVVLVGATVVLGSIGLGGWYRAVPKQDWRTAAATIVAEAQPNDAVLIVPPAAYRNLALTYYLTRVPADGTRPPVLRLRSTEELAGLAATHPRVWVITWRRSALSRSWADDIAADYSLVDHRRQPTVDIDLYSATGP